MNAPIHTPRLEENPVRPGDFGWVCDADDEAWPCPAAADPFAPPDYALGGAR